MYKAQPVRIGYLLIRRVRVDFWTRIEREWIISHFEAGDCGQKVGPSRSGLESA